jgi:hypothetical protein
VVIVARNRAAIQAAVTQTNIAIHKSFFFSFSSLHFPTPKLYTRKAEEIRKSLGQKDDHKSQLEIQFHFCRAPKSISLSILSLSGRSLSVVKWRKKLLK